MDVQERLKDLNMKFRLNLFDMFMKGRYTDVTLVCDEGTEVWAHKFVLASASSVLKGMFREDANKPGERQVIRIAGSKYQDLIALIQWIYLGFFKVTEVNGRIVDIAEGLKIDLDMNGNEENTDSGDDTDNPDDPDVNITEVGDDEDRQVETKNVKLNHISDSPVSVNSEPTPILVNDDIPVVPVEEAQSKDDNMKPMLIPSNQLVPKKEPIIVKLQTPIPNTHSENVNEKPTDNQNIADFKNEVRRKVFTPIKRHTSLGQPGSVSVKLLSQKSESETKKEEAQCPLCRKKFLNKLYMLAHYKKEHAKQGKKFACIKCNFKAPYNEQVMTAHLRMHELADASQKSNKNPTGEREVTHGCDLCDLKFRSLDYLKLHMEAKHYATRYLCPSCSYESSSKEALKVHNDLIHKKQPKDPIKPEAREDGEVDVNMMDASWSIIDAVPMVSTQQSNAKQEMNFLKSWGS